MLADINIPWSATTTWILGLVGALFVYCLLATAFIQSRKIFGRRPPLDDQLQHLDSSLRASMKQGDDHLQTQLDQIVARRAEHESELKLSFAAIGEKFDDMKADIFADGQRRSDATNKEIKKLAVAIGRLDERTGGSTQIQV